MKIVLRGNDNQAKHLDDIRNFLTLLSQLTHQVKLQVCIEKEFISYLHAKRVDTFDFESVRTLPDDTAIVLSIGGDGTFLRTAAWMNGSSVPVMGINTGHLGYLSGFSLQDMGEIVIALSGRYEISPRVTFRLESKNMPRGFYPYALNEISVSKGDTTSMVDVHAYVNGNYLADYQADGLVVSTPTGSTAYNLSCGGPILEPTLKCMTLSPIAPHSLTLRPLVISADSELELVVHSRGEECHVGIDGRTFSIPSDGSRLRIRKSRRIVNVAHQRGIDFAEVLREKLKWGVK